MERLYGFVMPFSDGHLKRVAQRVAEDLIPIDKGLREVQEVIGYDTVFFRNLASALSKYPAEVQQQFLQRLCGPNGANFRNGEELGSFLARVNTTPWLQPKDPLDETFLQEQVSKINPVMPIRLIREDSVAKEARKKAGERVVVVDKREREHHDLTDAERAARGAGWWITWDAAIRAGVPNEGAFGPLFDAAGDAAEAANWIIERIYKNGDPFEHLPLLEIWGQGVWPIGAVENPTTKQKEFAIFVPSSSKAA